MFDGGAQKSHTTYYLHHTTNNLMFGAVSQSCGV
jgi:hypothetical protein